MKTMKEIEAETDKKIGRALSFAAFCIMLIVTAGLIANEQWVLSHLCMAGIGAFSMCR